MLLDARKVLPFVGLIALVTAIAIVAIAKLRPCPPPPDPTGTVIVDSIHLDMTALGADGNVYAILDGGLHLLRTGESPLLLSKRVSYSSLKIDPTGRFIALCSNSGILDI